MTVHLLVVIVFASVSEARGATPVETTGNIFFSSQYLLQDDRGVTQQSDVERIVGRIIDTYTNAGFPFCRVFPLTEGTDSTIEKIVLHIEEGERVIVSDFLFENDGKTKTSSVSKVAQVTGGSYFSTKDIEHAKENLLKTGVFTAVDETILRQNSQYYVLLNLYEKNSDYLQASGSLGDEDSRFNFSFYSLNLLGTLRRFQFRYEYRKLFSLQFTEPILLYPAVFDIDFSLWTYDSIRLMQFHAIFTTPLWRFFTFKMLSGVESVSALDDDTVSQGQTDNIIGIGCGFNYESSTFKCYQQLYYDYLFRTYDRWRILYDADNEFHKLNVRMHYYRASTDSVEFFDHYRLGGARNLRGYREDQFFVTRAFWINLEYKRLFVFPLFDAALIAEEIFYSYGVGLHAQSRIADASVVIAWPKGGSWQDGKIHLLFEKGF